MAGIKVPQHEIFKIGTSKLKYYKWDLHITKKEAFLCDELIPLFQGEEFRAIAKILNKNPKYIDYTKYLFALYVDKKSDFKRANSKRGFKINGIKFKRFVGTTGGLKGDTVLYVNEEIYEELYEVSECGRNKDIPFIPAKLEAYRALFCSASQPILSPNKILVVKDCIIKYKDTVINLDDSDVIEPTREVLKDIDLENNISDGFSLCTIDFMKKISEKLELDYIPSGVCLRNAWFKGMLYPFPILEFIETYNNNNYMIEDIWGNIQDIRECEMITTESSLKLWKCYNSIEDYMTKYKDNGFDFSVTKISPKKLDDIREVNYQYLQSYDFDENDIKELCQPTIDYLKKSMCGDYNSTIEFLGIDGNLNDNSWQQALFTNKYMLNDPYIIDSVHRMIKKKIDDAKIGKLRIGGNYQIASGDPFALMQSICGLETTGLLNANECYSKYWNDKNEKEVVIFRSPMTSHNNIRKCQLANNDNLSYWYQYMDTIIIINGFDSFCMAENGCDYDSDILYSTNNKVLLNKHIVLPAIQCVQRNAEKIIPTEEDIILSNLNGMDNKVGSITNKVTNMKEVQSRFQKGSDEYKEMEYRMECGQLYQQNELDKIKGIVFKPMPRKWYSIKDCETEFDKTLCANRKPYFFIYIYDYVKKEYNDYIKLNQNKCIKTFGIKLEELLSKENKTKEEEDFIYWYNRKMPIGFGDCSMNKICNYVEQEFDKYKSSLKSNGMFDYNLLKVKRRCTEEHRNKLFELSQEYVKKISQFKVNKNEDLLDQEDEDFFNNRDNFKNHYYNIAKEICPNDEERMNICLDLCYGYKNNRQFCWDIVGELIIKRLEEIK